MTGIGRMNRANNRPIPTGCERFTDGEIDMLNCLKYSYFMEIGRLVENPRGMTKPEYFRGNEAIYNTSIDVLFKTVSERMSYELEENKKME